MVKLIHQMHGAGFFSNFNAVINRLLYDVEGGRCSAYEVNWYKSSEELTRYHNPAVPQLWTEFFEPVVVDGAHSDEKFVRGYASYAMTHVGAYFHLYTQGSSWRDEYNRVYKKYIRLKPHIQDEISSYYSAHMKDKHCIGVHYRNPIHDRENPWPGPSAERFIEMVQQQMVPDKENVVYLATDVESAIEPFKEVFGDALLVRKNVTRSTGHSKEVHADQQTPANGLARDVLLDCLLLAKAEKLIHITSNVATAVGYINPKLKMIYARYDDNDERAFEPVLYRVVEEHEFELNITGTGKDQCELLLLSSGKTILLDSWSLNILYQCDGTRTKSELIDGCRASGEHHEITRNHMSAVRTIRKLLRGGIIKEGQLKHPEISAQSRLR